MNLKKHYLMTGLALFFLGIIIAKPGESFQPKEKRICRFEKTRMTCETKNPVYKLDDKGIYYQYE